MFRKIFEAMGDEMAGEWRTLHTTQLEAISHLENSITLKETLLSDRAAQIVTEME